MNATTTRTITAPEGIQLKMNFNAETLSGENTFRKNMYSASFSILFELRTPTADADLESVVARYSPLAEFAENCTEIPCGLAFTDDETAWDSFPVADFAAALLPKNRDRHVIYLSGRGRTEESAAGALAQCRLEGFHNVVCVSGRQNPDSPQKNGCESCVMLKMNAENPEPLFAGAVINPFKYDISATFGQYFKLVKKVHAGAAFGVLQFGLDARKLQELNLHLARIDKPLPLISRFMLLSPGAAEDICAGKYPGICFPQDFREAVRGEMQHSIAQFEAAQWRRLQLHAAGCRFLGCSAIQLSGVENPALAKIAYQQILEAFEEFKDYREWLYAYNDYYSRIDMAPYPHRFYLYDNLLRNEGTDNEPKLTRTEMPLPSAGEKFRYNLSKLLFSKAGESSASARRLSKKIIAGCKGCTHCRLPDCLYVCPERCPGYFANGPCGEITEAGDCPYTGAECPHNVRLRLACFLNEYPSVEETVVKNTGV